jgi:hypothetical protein
VLLAVVGTGLLGSACSSGSPTRSVASLPGHAGGPAQAAALSGDQGAAQSDRDMVAFARCMRSHGVAMSDPAHVPGHQGLSIQLPPQDATTLTGYHACNHFIAGIVQAKAAHGAQETAPHLQALTNYAQCMRDHDIDMLDPTSQGSLNLGNVPGITDDFGRYSPQFRHADSACRHLLPAGVHDDGTGP